MPALEVSNSSSLQELFKEERKKLNFFHKKEVLQHLKPLNAMFKEDMELLEPIMMGWVQILLSNVLWLKSCKESA